MIQQLIFFRKKHSSFRPPAPNLHLPGALLFNLIQFRPFVVGRVHDEQDALLISVKHGSVASHSGKRKLLFPATKTNKSRLDRAACKGMDDIISFEQKAQMSLIFSTVFPPHI